MKMRKATYVASALTFAVCTAGVIGGSVSAAQAGSTKTNRQHQQESRYETQIAMAMSDGKLTLPTGVTKDALISEHESLASEVASASKTDRKSVRKKVRDEAKAWAEQHGIAAKWLFGFRHIR